MKQANVNRTPKSTLAYKSNAGNISQKRFNNSIKMTGNPFTSIPSFLQSCKTKRIPSSTEIAKPSPMILLPRFELNENNKDKPMINSQSTRDPNQLAIFI